VYVLILLEDLGFCAPGASGAFVERGTLGPGGALPTNTHGGMLSGAHGGSLHLTEAVRQLRGEAAERQVSGARLALVHGAGGSLSSHTSLVLGT
jgi:acetyl-CoA acetyltransferase